MRRKLIQIFIHSSVTLLVCLFFISISIPQVTAATWSISVIDDYGDVGKYNSMKIGNDGFPRISYYDQTNGSLKYMRCRNVDCSARTITTVETGNVGEFTSLAVGSDGFARISYYVNGGGLKYARCQNDDCTVKITTIVDAMIGFGEYTSLAIGSDGFARITYIDNNDGSLYYAQCQNDSCSSHVITYLDGLFAGVYNSIAIAPDGFARISYEDSTNSSVKYIQCQSADCSINVITTIATGVNVAATSLAIGSDGFARVTYSTVSALGLVICQNASCSSRTSKVLDSTSNKISSSLSLINDIPNVAYMGQFDGNLYYAQCTSSSCAGDSIDVVDSTSTVSFWLSLAITGNNKYISYYDNDKNLKLAMSLGSVSPTPIPSQNNTSSSGSSNSSPTAPLCTALAPSGAPNLFQIKTTKTSATLYFAPASGNISSYFVSYGYQSGDNRFGIQFPYGASSGVVTYTLQSLTPNKTYYVQVRGGNGCMPGSWSNEMQFMTNGKTVYQQVSL